MDQKTRPQIQPSTSPSSPSESKSLFMNLPTELHLQISQYLIYPDALSLKHTNRHFYGLVYTDVDLKVEWLIRRRILHLDCPHDRACELGSDVRFCRGSIRLLMKRRREHGECETRDGGRGCLVLETRVCEYRRQRMGKFELFREWLLTSARGKEVLWSIVAAVVGVGISIVFMLTGLLLRP